MKHISEILKVRSEELKKNLEDLHKPFAGMIETDLDPYGVIADEINQDHANGNRI